MGKRFVRVVLVCVLLMFLVQIGFGQERDKRGRIRDTAKPTKRAQKSKRQNSRKRSKSAKRKINSNRSTTKRKSRIEEQRSDSSAAIRKRFLLNKPFGRFTKAERLRVKKELDKLRLRISTQQFLLIIQIAEGGEPNIMVGDQPGCRVRTLEKHPGEVLPNRCFFPIKFNGRDDYSTASGNYQITRTNFRSISEMLTLKDFGVINQQIAALELIRRGGRKPSQVLKGFIALVKGDVRTATKLATTDWASSIHSDLPGKKSEDWNNIVNRTIRDYKSSHRDYSAKIRRKEIRNIKTRERSAKGN